MSLINVQTRISVIIPVFNSEKYLDQCIRSVLNQSFRDFELILVNDGSTDKSIEICNQFAERDKRIKVFTQKNKGVSTARNLGLENSKGEWINFIDSDDYVEKNYLNDFVVNLKPNVNLYLQGMLGLMKDGRFVTVIDYKTHSEIDRNTFLKSYNIMPFFFGPTCKLFRKEIIEKNRIRFDESISVGEDTLFNLDYLKLLNEKLILIDSKNYIYRNTDSSLSKSPISYQVRKKLYEDIKTRLEPMTSNKMHFYKYTLYMVKTLYTDNMVKDKFKMLREMVAGNKMEMMGNYTDSKILNQIIHFLISTNNVFLLHLMFKRFYR